MASEVVGWIFIGAVALLAMRAQTTTPAAVGTPSAQNEVDPTRWRHEGEQPLSFKDGNRRAEPDPVVHELYKYF